MAKNRGRILYGLIDESGASGVGFGKNDYLVVSMVLFDSESEMKKVRTVFKDLRRELGLKEDYEFHYSHNNNRIRAEVVSVAAKLDFSFLTVAIKKNNIKKFASYTSVAECVIKELQHCSFDAIKVIIDTNPSFYKELNKTKKKYNMKKLTFRQGDSVRDDRLQLADYVVGMHSRIIKRKNEPNFKKIESKLKTFKIIGQN